MFENSKILKTKGSRKSKKFKKVQKYFKKSSKFMQKRKNLLEMRYSPTFREARTTKDHF